MELKQAVHVARVALDKSYRISKSLSLASGLKLVSDLSSLTGTQHIKWNNLTGDWTKFTSRIAQMQRLQSFSSISIVNHPSQSHFKPCYRFIIAFEGVKEVGIVGTLIRTAKALSFDAVVFCDQMIDPLDPELLRCSQGALLAMPFVVATRKELVNFANSSGIRCVSHNSGGQPVEETSDGVVFLFSLKPGSPRGFTPFSSSLHGCPLHVQAGSTLYQLRCL